MGGPELRAATIRTVLLSHMPSAQMPRTGGKPAPVRVVRAEPPIPSARVAALVQRRVVAGANGQCEDNHAGTGRQGRVRECGLVDKGSCAA